MTQEITEKEFGKQLSKIDFWEKPMIFDIFALIMIFLFTFSVFFTITFINSPDPKLQRNGWINVVLATMFIFGFSLKGFTDKLYLTEDSPSGKIIVLDETLTRSRFEKPSGRGIGATLFGTGIILGSQLGISIFLAGVPLSIYDLTIDKITFAMVSAVSEEIFFLSLQDATASGLKWGSIPLNIGLFGLYHGVVYASNLLAILYVLIGRAIYSIIYAWLKRPACSMMGHLAGNLITLLQI